MRFELTRSEVISLVVVCICMVGCGACICSHGGSDTHVNYQNSYQGSDEQKKDLHDIDEYSRKHSGF